MSRPAETNGSWKAFGAAALAFFTVMSGATVPTPIYPVYAQDFGFSPIQITVIFAAYAVGVIGALLGTGPWSEQVGRKPLMLGGLLAALLAGVCFIAAQGLWLLLLARFLQGVSAGIFTSTATVAVAEMAPPGRDRTGSLGATVANMGGLGMGSILSGAIMALMPAPMRWPYLLHLLLVGLSLWLLWRAPEPVRRSEHPKLRPQGIAVPGEVRDVFVPAAISAFAGFMICGFLGSVAPSFLGEILGYEGRHLLIGTVAGAVFLGSCVGQAGEQHIPERWVLPVGMGWLTVGVALLTVAFAVQDLTFIAAAIVFTGLGHGIAFKGGLSSLSRKAPEGQASAVTATYFTVAYVAISIPVLVIGALQDAVGLLPLTVGYGAAATILSAVSFVLILRRSGGGGGAEKAA